MNHFQDRGVILSVRGHGESGAITSILSENHGKCNGYVNAGRGSSRLRSALQQGNIVTFDWQSKSEGQLGRFDLELDRDIAVTILDDSRALLAVQSVCGLMDMFLAERERHEGLFHGTCAFLDFLRGDGWLPMYIMWEIAFLKEMGYGIDISKCAVTGSTHDLTHVSPKTGRAVCKSEAEPYISKLLEIPQFMLGEGLSDGDIIKGLKLSEYFLIHRLLQHSSYQQLPSARGQLENSVGSA